ncbi:hypothetical protein ABK040_009695 [Willaertia magna]
MKALQCRGRCYAKMKENNLALKDYTQVIDMLQLHEYLLFNDNNNTTINGNNIDINQSSIESLMKVYLDKALLLDSLQNYKESILNYNLFLKYFENLNQLKTLQLREGKITIYKYENYIFELFQSYYNKYIAILNLDQLSNNNNIFTNKENEIFNCLNKCIEMIEKMSDPLNSTEIKTFSKIYLTRANKYLQSSNNTLQNSLQNKELAINDYTKCLIYDKHNKKAITNLAILLYDCKNYKRALIYLTKLIKLDNNNNLKAIINRAICYMKLDSYLEAIQDFKLAQQLSNNGNTTTTNNNEQQQPIITLYIQCGRCYKKYYEQLVNKSNNDTTTINNSNNNNNNNSNNNSNASKLKQLYFERGTIRHYLKKYEESILDYSRCLEIDPQHLNALYNRGYIRYKYLKQYDRALKDYENLLLLNINDNKARMEKGCCLFYLRRDEEAKSEWEFILTKEPNNEMVKSYLAQLK